MEDYILQLRLARRAVELTLIEYGGALPKSVLFEEVRKLLKEEGLEVSEELLQAVLTDLVERGEVEEFVVQGMWFVRLRHQ